MEHVEEQDEQAELVQENVSDDQADNEDAAEAEEEVLDNNH